jgi:hypothetical protein
MNLNEKISVQEFTLATRDLNLVQRVSTPVWNRLEGQPRGEDMQRALKAEVRDALWMLTRQWQLGEFAGDDAGTPVFANLDYQSSPFGDDAMPLEPQVEAAPFFSATEKEINTLGMRVQMGNYWLKLMDADPALKPFRQEFIDDADFALPDEAAAEGNMETVQFLSLYKGRSLDGFKLYTWFSNPAGFNVYAAAVKARLVPAFAKFKRWYESVYLQGKNEGKKSWDESRLEYRFEQSVVLESIADRKPTGQAGKQNTKKVVAEEYYHGHLDWYHFKLDAIVKENAGDLLKKVKSLGYNHLKQGNRLIPVPVDFDGMPEPRFWTFEDGATNFAAVTAGKNDLGKLALIEFALVYSNDWSIVPLTVPVGSFTEITTLSIVDSFGKVTAIPPVSSGSMGNWDQWSYFSLDRIKTGVAAKPDASLFLPQSIMKAQESELIEEVSFIRDEMANLVWAIETIVPAPFGRGVSGREYATKDIPRQADTRLSYLKKTYLPGNWIPFMAVSNAEKKMVLRRGKTLDANNQPMRPNTSLLRVGINKDNTLLNDGSGKAMVYDIEESEVPREGIVVRKSFQRTRWTNGEVFTWAGFRKGTGRGEGASGLAFDVLGGK